MNLDSDRLTETEPELLSGLDGLHRLEVDFDAATVTVHRKGDGAWMTSDAIAFDDPRAYEAIATAWLRIAWDTKYQWSFSWFGRPVIQLPEDLMRAQELIYELQPDVIIETGVAHGGSLIFYATICKALGHGRVIGVELPRSPLEDRSGTILAHELADAVTIVKGDSIDPQVVERVYDQIDEDETVLLLLDSAHSKAHVLSELKHYTPLVKPGGYAIVQDGHMMELVARHNGPRTERDWPWNNPLAAVREFVDEHHGWRVVLPPIPFNEGVVDAGVTHWTGGWIRRIV